MTLLVRRFVVVLGCAAAHAAAAQPPMDLSPAEMIKRSDADGDGMVSRDEFIKARTAWLEEAFGRMDANGDGKLDEREAEAGAEHLRPLVAGGRGAVRQPDGPRPRRPDGERPQRPAGERPSRPGAGAFAKQAFDRFDGDGDGALSREEFAAGMARMRESMPAGRPAPGGAEGPVRPDRGPAEGFRRPPQQD